MLSVTIPNGLGYMLLILVAIPPICKEFSMHFAKFVGLENAGGSNEPRCQMAVLVLPYGKTDRTRNCLLQS
jgi:hypothetical protein